VGEIVSDGDYHSLDVGITLGVIELSHTINLIHKLTKKKGPYLAFP
jgi:hypothetical protein